MRPEVNNDDGFWEGYNQAKSEHEDRIAELEEIIEEYEEKLMDNNIPF